MPTSEPRARCDPAPPAAVPVGLADDLHWLMARAARGLGQQVEASLAGTGISTRGYVVLASLTDGAHRSQLAIAHCVAIDKSTLVGVLDELERGGLITRQPDPADRRNRIITITPRGRTTLARATRAVRQVNQQALGHLGDTARRAFLDTLTRLGTGHVAGTFDTRPSI